LFSANPTVAVKPERNFWLSTRFKALKKSNTIATREKTLRRLEHDDGSSVGDNGGDGEEFPFIVVVTSPTLSVDGGDCLQVDPG
jgi:hypothetical protein